MAYGVEGYPIRLTDLHDPPALLWSRGLPRLLSTPAVAVVGARKATPYGLRTARELGRALALEGLTVASGLALGVDAAAHQGALDVGGDTVAILGTGVDVPSPRANLGLYRKIAASGLILSEFLPGTRGHATHFPRRNRVIAAWGGALVVVEASHKSGALISVDHALDLGRPVHAVPGPIDRFQSRGTNRLLADGAHVVTSVAALARELAAAAGIAAGPPRPPPAQGEGQTEETQAETGPRLRPAQVEVWDALESGPQSVEALTQVTGWPVAHVQSVLGHLELDGRIVRAADGTSFQRVHAGPSP